VAVSPLSLALAGCTAGASPSCNTSGLFSNNTASTNFLISPLSFGTTDNGIGKIDYHLNEHHNFSAEYYDGDGIAVEPVTAVNQGYWSTPMEVHTRVIRVVWTWVPNSSWVNDARFGYDHVLMPTSSSYDCSTRPAGDTTWVSGSNAPDYAARYNFIPGNVTCGFPTVVIQGFTGNTLAGATGIYDTSGVERFLDSVSWTHGNHITKMGGEFVISRGSLLLNQHLGKGTLQFNTGGKAYAGSSGLEDFMAGKLSSASIQTGNFTRQFRYPAIAGYIQDDWRIVPRLTVNLGLRYEYEYPVHEVNNLLGSFSPTNATGMIQAGGSNGDLYHMSRNGIGPRFGLAWDIFGNGKTVLRAGANMIYAEPFAATLFNVGLNLVPTALNLSKDGGTTFVNPGGTINLAQLSISPASIAWAQGTPVFGNFTSTASTCTNLAPCNIGGVTGTLQYPMVLNWNLGVQRAVTKNLTLDVSYVGTHGQHLPGILDVNQPVPNAATNGTATATAPATENANRPYTVNGQYPWLGQVKLLGSVSQYSNYNSLQIVARERATHGLTFLASYTFSHTLDLTSGEMNPGLPQDSHNPQVDYGNSNFDLRHRFTFGPVYQIPGKAGHWQMLQGWTVTSTVWIDSGRPLLAQDTTNDVSSTGNRVDRWTLAGTPSDFTGFGNQSHIPCFYNSAATSSAAWQAACTQGLPQACVTAAANEPTGPGGTTGTANLNKFGCYMMGSSIIVPPAQGTFGTMGRNAIFGLGFWEWDFSVAKSWKINEKLNSEFRAEIYNLPNAVRYAAPNANLASPSTFGSSSGTPDIITNSPIIGTGGPRKIQLGLRFTF
jgi:hypothetical protein